MQSVLMAGRKPKGNRAAVSTKVPAEYKPILEAEAARRGMPMCDLMAVLAAEALGLPEPTYLDKNKDPGQMSIAV